MLHLATETKPQVRRDRLLRLQEVETITGLKKSTIYLLMNRREFPASVQITARCVAWPESRVLQFVQDRIAAADKSAKADVQHGEPPQGSTVAAAQRSTQ